MQSGITASKELLSQFNNFLGNPNTFALLVTISSESLIPVELLQSASLAPSEPDSFDANLSQLCPHLQAKQPIYALLRRYVDAPHLVAATYVPDAAPVRQKMLFASTRHSLTRELGTEHFRDHIFATDPRDLSPLGFRENDAHARLDAPLTEEESALGAVKRAEAEAGAGAAMREIHLSKSLAMPVADDALAALREIGNGGGDGMVVLKIDAESESVHLDHGSASAGPATTIAELVQRTSKTEPRFTFFRYAHTHTHTQPGDGGAITSAPLLFIYTNPSTGGPRAIKNRMLYPLMKRAVVEAAAREGVVVIKKFEVAEPAELTEEDVLEELHPRAEVKQGFSRPKRPGR